MREILFRGKRLDYGEWVYGYLFASDTDSSTFVVCGSWNVKVEFEVDSDTIGQYTGLTDKNGVKIFEGDIINYNGSREVVRFDTSLRIPCFTTGIGRGSSTAPHPYKISARHVIIGNIHDNPDLLTCRDDG